MAQQQPKINAGTLAVLPEPHLPGLLDVLPDEGGVPTLRGPQRLFPLQVNVEAWNSYEQDYAEWVSRGYTDLGMIFRCFWGGVEVAESVVLKDMTPTAAEFFPVHLEIPQHYLVQEGKHSIYYTAEVDLFPNPAASAARAIRIDRTAPNGGAAAPLRSDNVRDINQAAQAVFNLNRWPDIRLEDRAQLFLIPANQAGLPLQPTVEVLVTELNKNDDPFAIRVPAHILRDGQFRAVVRLVDRSENVGAEASWPVNIQLGGAVALPAPIVPQAADGLINIEDARLPVVVQIPQITQAVLGNTVQAYWNERALASWPVLATPQWPAIIPVPWDTVTADGFTGPALRSVRYELVQNTGSQDSPVVQVNVDLRVAGPDPQGPAELNTQLNPVVVGRRGDNHISSADANQDVVVRVQLYDNPVAGEVFELYWGNLARIVARYTVTGLEVRGVPVEFTPVPYQVVTEAGSGPTIQVFYRTFNGVNRQRSNPTPVRVELPLARIQVPTRFLYPQGFITCEQTPWKGITFTIPGGQAVVQAGDRVELRWQLFRTLNDDASLAAQPLMPAPVYLAAVPITPEGAVRGQALVMDQFTSLIFDVFNKQKDMKFAGYARVGYRITKTDGQRFEAPLNWLRIDIERAVNVVCTATGDVRVR